MSNQENDESEFPGLYNLVLQGLGLDKVMNAEAAEESHRETLRLMEQVRERQRQLMLQQEAETQRINQEMEEAKIRWKQAWKWQKTIETQNLLNEISDGFRRVRVANEDGSQCADIGVVVIDNKVDCSYFADDKKKSIFKSRQIHNGLCLVDETFFGETARQKPGFSVLYVFFMFESDQTV